MVNRGEIWLVNLDPSVGAEIKKSRPCVIVSPPEMHDHLKTVMIAPMTTGSRPAPFRIPVSHAGKAGLLLLDQLRTVDKERLVKKFGAIDARTLKQTLVVVQEIFTF